MSHIARQNQDETGTTVNSASPGSDSAGMSVSPRLLLECLGEGVCGLDTQGRITFLNPAAAQMLRLDLETAAGQSIHDLTHHRLAHDIVYAREDCPLCRKLLEEQGSRLEHEVFWRPDGSSFPVEFAAYPLQENGVQLGTVLTFSDITQRKIHAQEMLYILASAHCLLWYADVQFVSADKQLRWFLWPPDEAAARRFLPFYWEPGKTFAEAFYACRLDEDKPRSNAFGRQEILAGRSYQQEYRCRTEDGEVRWISERVEIETVAEGRWRAAGVCTDITELKRREQEIEVLNERLQRAMTETHHRVKNNLQIIAAMIDLQTIEQPKMLPLEEFARLGQHVRTLAAIHDILTQEAKTEGQMESVSARTILDKLLPMIGQMANQSRLRYTLEDTRLSSRQSTALALITNELVSNAQKHGQGEIEVTFTVQDGEATLQVCDDGPGFPPGFDPATAANTGLELVQTLATWDLQGRVTYENRADAPGGRASVVFPLNGGPPAAETPTAL